MAAAPGALFMTRETVAGERLRYSARTLRLTGLESSGLDLDDAIDSPVLPLLE